MSSPKRKRDVPVLFWVSADEMELIQQKMAQFGTKNLSAYLRKMAVDGYVVQLDLPELKELVSLLRRSSNNLNQLTRKVHETGRIYDADLEDKARYTRIAENAKESIRVLKEKLADVLENRSERNRWISHFTQFSTMETLDRKAVVHMIQSIKVIGKKELEITFTYQDEYQKAIQLIQLAEQTSQRKVG